MTDVVAQTRDMKTRFRAALHRLASLQETTKSMWSARLPLQTRSSSSSQGNAGDSRTVLGVKGRAKPLSFDHKPQNEGLSWLQHALQRYHISDISQAKKRELLLQAASSISDA